MVMSVDCDVCQKRTAHKRAWGIGTLIMFLLTAGLWLLAMPFYPKRCQACGTLYRANNPPTVKRVLYLLGIGLAFIALVLVGEWIGG